MAKGKEVENLIDENKALREQLSTNIRLNNSQISQNSSFKESQSSEYRANEEQAKKLEKVNKNLEYENTLLKSELQKEREVVFKINKR